jgi:hypothetical protein
MVGTPLHPSSCPFYDELANVGPHTRPRAPAGRCSLARFGVLLTAVWLVTGTTRWAHQLNHACS